jgi:hypothetical protein
MTTKKAKRPVGKKNRKSLPGAKASAIWGGRFAEGPAAILELGPFAPVAANVSE